SLNKLSDYLAGGRPIIYYGRSSYDPVSAAGAGFTVPPGDPAAVADAIERLFALSPEERREMGARGQAYLAEHHNIPRLAERLLAVIEPVPAGEARPGWPGPGRPGQGSRGGGRLRRAGGNRLHPQVQAGGVRPQRKPALRPPDAGRDPWRGAIDGIPWTRASGGHRRRLVCNSQVQ